MTNYWKNAEVLAREKLLDISIDKLEALIKNAYLKQSDRILKDLLEVYETILRENETPLKSHLYQFNRYYDMLNKIQSRLNELGVYENLLFNEKLEELYINNQKIIDATYGLQSNIRTELVEETIKKVWVDDGLRFSDRIWKDKAALMEKLQEVMVDSVGSGKSIDRLTAELMEKFSVSYNEAKRLVRTEMAHTAIQSTIDKYKDAGVTRYRLLSEPDCCEECSGLKEEVFPIDDTEHLPPEHPNCRCSILAVW